VAIRRKKSNMRKIILVIIIGYSNFVVGQSRLSITPYFCQSWGDISNFEHKIELYIEGKLIAKEFYPINDFTVNNLKTGKYLIKYNTIFNQEFERKINLNKKNKSIRICIDEYRKIKEKTFIEELQTNDTLEIWAYQTGCEYLDFGRLQLFKKGDNIEAILIANGEVHQRILIKSQLGLVEEIEHKIQLIKENEEDGFLRTSHYEIRLNGTEKVITKFGVEAIGYDLKIKDMFKK
jgi:hypothetical protein